MKIRAKSEMYTKTIAMHSMNEIENKAQNRKKMTKLNELQC